MEVVRHLDNDCKIVRHPCGVDFLYDPSKGYGALTGKQGFGDKLSNAQFVDQVSLQARVDALHEYGSEMVLSKRTSMELAGYREIFDKTTGEHIGILSDKYKLAQNRTLFKNFTDAVQLQGLKPVGRIDVGENGHTVGFVTFLNEQYVIPLLQDYKLPNGEPENCALGIQLTNSYAGEMGVSGQVWGIEAFCKNICEWGSLAGEFWVPHSSENVDNITTILSGFINEVLENAPRLTKVCSDAEGKILSIGEAEDALWGTGIIKGIIDDVIANPKFFNKRLVSDQIRDISMFQLFNCATNAITIRPSSAYKSQISYTKSALKLLTSNPDRLMEHGRDVRENYLKRVSDQQVTRQEASAAKQNAPNGA